MGTEILLIFLAVLASAGAGFFAWLAALSGRNAAQRECEERIRALDNA